VKVAITTLVFCVAALLAVGLVMLYSSSMTQVGAGYLIKQLVWCALGLVACVTMAMLDYDALRKMIWPIVGATVLLLLLVLVFGRNVNGASRWLALGGFRIQPSELAKLTLLIMAAWYCDRNQRHMGDWKRGVILPALLLGPVLALIFVEPDRGTTILMAGVLSVMLLIAGVRWQYFAVPAVLGSVGLGVSFWHDPMRMNRILAWINLEENKDGVGFQAYQAMLALGAGGWSGLGLGNGRQKMGFVPEHHTDFIFSIIGEELGLVGTIGVVIAFVAFVIAGVYIAMHARDNFGMLLGCGITFLIGFQAFINIGVVTSALPNKGLPLPFISYGGSSLLMMLACVGVLLSIARHARDHAGIPDAVLAPDNPFVPRTA